MAVLTAWALGWKELVRKSGLRCCIIDSRQSKNQLKYFTTTNQKTSNTSFYKLQNTDVYRSKNTPLLFMPLVISREPSVILRLSCGRP